MPDYPTLGDAIMATQPGWLLAWLAVLTAANLGAVLFIAKKTPDGWRLRWEALAIIAAFLLAGTLMDYIYAQAGYVRLLGLAHLIVWPPVWAWIFVHRDDYIETPWFARYVAFYLLVAGLSLVIDAIDVARYLLGETGSMI